MNKVILIGRLTAEPEVRHTQSGTAVASYRLAVDRQYKKEGQPETDFLPCVAWGKGAEFASKYLHKGTKIAVEGKIQVRTYDDKDGKKVYVTEIIVDNHEFCESRAAASEPRDSVDASESPSAVEGYFAPANSFGVMGDVDDELPF